MGKTGKGSPGKGKSSKAKDSIAGEESIATHKSDINDKLFTSQYKMEKSNSSGCCAKLLFFLLLAVFCLVATVIYVDYKPGQLKMAYESMNIPPEAEASLGKGVNAVSDIFSTISTHVKEQGREAKRIIRSVLKDIDIGGVNMEHLLFAEKMDNADSHANG